ncbi:MAG TPA: DUF1343 domain-containing protein [Candidatus Tyrphobacter sp.]
MRRARFLGSLAAFGCAGAVARGQTPAPQGVELGDDVFLRDHARELAGRSIGVITNQTGVTSQGRSIVDAMQSNRTLALHALFAPEHGLRGDRPAGAFVESYRDERSGLPVYSLYGPDRHPSAQMLAGLDVLLFDIQDVGARAYTFISTMAYAMQSAAAHGVEFWVLDRPNPVGGFAVEGPVLDPRFASFIGLYPIPMRHGMTVGELAQLFNQHFGVGAKLRVIPMNGWRRSMIWPQTGLRWIRTSPNIPTWETTFVYLCTGLIDDAGVNNGVGTESPFFFAGAPELDARRLAERLSARDLPGVAFHPASWSPSRGANAGRSFSGVALLLSDPQAFLPVRTSVEILVTVRDLHRSTLRIETASLDRDWGTDGLRLRLLAGEGAGEITGSWQHGLDDFAPLRERFLLYS